MKTQRNWVQHQKNRVKNGVNTHRRDQNKMQSSSSLSAAERLLIMEALDHVYVTRQYRDMDCCSVCKKISIKNCSACGTFYCSNECQTYDWPKHREKCSRQREESAERSFSSSRQMRVASSVRNLNEDDKTIPMITNRGSPFTALANQLSKKTGNVISNKNKTFSSFKLGYGQYQSCGNLSSDLNSGLKENKTTSKGKNRKYSTRSSMPAVTSPPTDKKAARNDTTVPTVPLKAVETSPTSSGGSFKRTTRGSYKVVGTYRESPDRHWVIKLSNLERFEELQSILNKECRNYELVEPKVGLVCGCTYGEDWYRGRILSLTPEISVHFIDYGNISNYNLKLFKKLPFQMRTLPGLAFLIEFEKSTPDDYRTEDLESEKFTIEEVGKASDGAVCVKVIEDAFIPTVTSSPQGGGEMKKNLNRPRRRAIDSITATSTGMLFFLPGEGTTRFASIVPDKHKDANECIEKILNIDAPKSSPFPAVEGDYVLVSDKEGNIQRGKVFSKAGSSYSVMLVDCGNVIAADSVYPLPEHLKDFVELGVRVTVEEIFLDDELNLETAFFTVNGEPISGKWPCTLKDSNHQVVAKVFLEKPVKKLDSPPETVHLKSGSTVEIACVSSPNSFYVRSVDAETEQRFMDMNMEMIQYAPKAKHFPIPPSPGELCCAKFKEDDCFYRAVVQSEENGRIRVLFVDFGNEQVTDLRDVKPLPESLKKVPFFAVKVTLKNVSPKPWNNMIKEYIDKLDSENIELTLTYTGSLKNEVVLREKVSGVTVNNFIEKARNKKRISSREKDMFLDDDLRFTTPPHGGVCTLAILYIDELEFETSLTFWATLAELQNFNYVNAELSSLISKHCESVSVPYRPTYRELCLAEFEGSWYRAICAGHEGDVFKVFFVDFGNACELRSESIREMQEQFVEAPALAMNCILNGHERLKENPEMIPEIYKLLLNRINTCFEDVTITHFEDDTFLVKIPEIDAILSG